MNPITTIVKPNSIIAREIAINRPANPIGDTCDGGREGADEDEATEAPVNVAGIGNGIGRGGEARMLTIIEKSWCRTRDRSSWSLMSVVVWFRTVKNGYHGEGR
ncbi:hypothetical protein E3N88_02762 [Mikania micrantha]|uniref:Uncharacterized protein n=1 Tax=Mikania micrantha TaxID=192012 RepID=A0A5N6Q4V2_9ASTR|nr:hypothetical protein E3N88_02748 [Mikania micrantha]KAD7479626.1 hypothetical protein E3N88_02762 [Mikania micrantha]